MGAAASSDFHRHQHLMSDLDRLVTRQHQLIHSAFKLSDGALVHENTTEAEVLSRSIPPGSRCYVWKQDPTVARIGIRKVFLPHAIYPGPKDADIEVVLALPAAAGAVPEKDVKATAIANPDDDHDFLCDIKGDPFCFDLVHTFTVARMTLDMYVRDLKIDWKWNWDLNLAAGQKKTPLKIICHAGEKPNAVYHRGKKALKFYYFTEGASTTYLCRSFDIVAHETGHAILDALKPRLYSCHDGQAGALHEAFADLTAIFAILDQLDMCEDIIAETKGDLRQAKYLTAIGEQFATAMKANEKDAYSRSEAETETQEHAEVMGMRNANNTVTGKTCPPNDIYQLCNVFTGFVFDCLVDIFLWERNPKYETSDAVTLNRVARSVRRMLLLALFESSDVPSYLELAKGMASAAKVIARNDPGDVVKYQKIIDEHRHKRCLAVAGLPDKVEEEVDLNY